MTKKIERVTVERLQQVDPPPIVYRLSCGDLFSWSDIYPPTYCPFCGRLIDYAGPEGADDE